VLCLHCIESRVYRIFNVKWGKQLLKRNDEEIKESLCKKLKSFNNPQNARHQFIKIVTSVVVLSYQFANIIAKHQKPFSKADHIQQTSCRFFTGRL